VRGATAKLLHAQDGLEVVGSFDSVRQFLADDLREPPAVLLLDCDGDGGVAEASCRTAVSIVSRAHPTIKLALLCHELSTEIARCATEYRVGGVLLKNYTAEDVRRAIGYMASGRTIMPAGWQRAAASIQRDPQLLSPRLRQIHALLAQGLSNEQIAAELTLSPNTVKFHVRALYARLGVHNRVEASLLYAQLTRGGG
jgi:DNA-binding NarL/FixJ family response regulator